MKEKKKKDSSNEKVIKLKRILIDIIMDIAGSILYSAGIYTFARNAAFAPGGISGISLMLNYKFMIPIGLCSLILNIPLIILCRKFVGKRFIFKSLKTMIICTIMLDIVFPHTPAYTGSPVMAALYTGAFLGAGLAVFYMRGTSSGGTDFLIMTIRAVKPYLSIGVITFAIDLVVILSGGLVYGNADAVLYGIMTTFVTSLVVDRIMYGLNAGVLVIIITTKGEEAAEVIGKHIDRGSTQLKAIGSYTKEDRDVLFCACSKSQMHEVREKVMEVDDGAFIMMTEISHVYGEGFIMR